MIDEDRDSMNAIIINLARRSRLLVERQLRLLSEMERDERDPERLAALSQLDSIAARLRRNEENLLVLAGGQARRRTEEPTAGMRLDELVLSALSQVESYQRIRSDIEDGWLVSGHAVADLVHLIAELCDNATAFSPPESPVRISCGRDGDGVLLEIADAGIGLAPGALLEANALLTRPPELDLAASERMGLVVVSHLAARHRVRVGLTSSSAGTCASVRIPGELLLREGE